jgi:hypothetical protein
LSLRTGRPGCRGLRLRILGGARLLNRGLTLKLRLRSLGQIGALGRGRHYDVLLRGRRCRKNQPQCACCNTTNNRTDEKTRGHFSHRPFRVRFSALRSGMPCDKGVAIRPELAEHVHGPIAHDRVRPLPGYILSERSRLGNSISECLERCHGEGIPRAFNMSKERVARPDPALRTSDRILQV